MATRRKAQIPAYKKKKNENRLGMVISAIAILVVAAVVGINSYSLHAKQEQYKAREAELEAQIQEQLDRAEELKDFSSYTTTKKYVEEVAKEKLGLVYEDEIIFKKEK